MCYSFHRLIPNFSRIVDPLNKMLHKNQPQKFENIKEEEQSALMTLKERLIYHPILPLPRAKDRFIINSDD